MKKIIGLMACVLLSGMMMGAAMNENGNKDQNKAISSNTVASQITGESKIYVLYPNADSISLTTDDTSTVSWSISKQGDYGTAIIHGDSTTVWLIYTPSANLLVEDTLIVALTNAQNTVSQKVIYAEVYKNKYQFYGEKQLDRLRKEFYHPVSGLFVESINLKKRCF